MNHEHVGNAAMNAGHRQRPTRRRSLSAWEPVFAAVLGAAIVALVFVSQNHWRRGLLGLGMALLAGAVLRLVLPTRRVGLLVVRGRVFDVATLAVLGTMIIVVTLAVPVPGS
ncbi:DUF3017 domain-containing protein [Candidatus Protofrankia californiensis]|uniref:DUF3017 domain-containing protein n=1 Tax=Candidatus Protofrankia californiensis TaxID=1839754 RepID=UPI001F4946CA|nr:DUF3017 domain-containing protein [Candidatus Protofrankia californiensis]